MKSKTVEQSKVILGNLMQPAQANIAGNVHGGEIMKLMDNAGGIVARKHARSNIVTARVDILEFHQPIHIGNYVKCVGQLTFVGTSSMEVLITVTVEDLSEEEEPRVALTGYFTFVALDKNGKPITVPRLEITNEEEAKRFEEGKQRYLLYKRSKK